MKDIKRFNNINENDNEDNEYFLFIIHENIDSYHIFEDYKDAFSFLLNTIYYYFNDNEQVLEELDKIDNLANLDEYYEELYDAWNVNKISYIWLDKDNAKVSDWIKLRRDTKKYNL